MEKTHMIGSDHYRANFGSGGRPLQFLHRRSFNPHPAQLAPVVVKPHHVAPYLKLLFLKNNIRANDFSIKFGSYLTQKYYTVVKEHFYFFGK